MKIGKWCINKSCGGRWFPHAGYGYWDGIRFFLRQPINLKIGKRRSRHDNALIIDVGPLMIWKDR